MTITMDIAKAIVRREHVGKVTQEEIDVFLKGLTDTEFTELVTYTIACNEVFNSLQRKGVM